MKCKKTRFSLHYKYGKQKLYVNDFFKSVFYGRVVRYRNDDSMEGFSTIGTMILWKGFPLKER